ncbi:MAG: ATP-binding protein [Candidatus Sericytochromatia bacterium]
MSTGRLDPDALLRAIQRHSERAQRGQLKIFFGMAPGVGKTYAMLQAAHQRQREGVQVVVGYAESHGRAETDALLTGLVVLPRREVDYRGTHLQEMDLDAILALRPELVLVDELAHSNAPGSRHLKRYQDVLELLEAGIHVYTTVNVQHIESRADTVRQITGAVIHERVPDSLLDLADEIALIDLGPDALLERLAEGKVYLGDRAQRAVTHFFQKGNLTALREMALRLTAERVDQDLQDYLSQRQLQNPWKSTDRLLVAVSPSPSSAQLLRWTRRMAYNLDAPWLAVYVDTGRVLNEDDQRRLNAHLELARELGAEVLVTQGSKLMKSLLHLALQHNATQIILGKPQQSSWRDLLNGSIWRFHHFLYSSGQIDICIVDSSRREEGVRPRPWRLPRLQLGREYAWASLALAGLTLSSLPLVGWLGYWSIALLYLVGVLLLAFQLARGPALFSAALSALLWNFFFIPPVNTLHIQNVHDVLMCVTYFVVASAVVGLTTRLRDAERFGRVREERLSAMARFVRELDEAASPEAMITAVRLQLEALMDAPVRLFLADSRAEGLTRSDAPDKEWSVAKWVYEHHRPAGRFTDTLPSAEGFYLPLQARNGVYGVMGLTLPPERELPFDQRHFLEALARQLGLSLEREALQESTTRARLNQLSEAMYEGLLNSVSHELRTPITTIRGAVHNLQEPEIAADPTLYRTLLDDLDAASQRLNHLVANLLDMSRLQSGRLVPNRSWCDLGDIVRAALHSLQRELVGYPLELVIPAELPPVRVDFTLLEQVITNLIHNAISHNPVGTALAVRIAVHADYLVLEVCDRGKGLDPVHIPQLFEKFYRAPGARAGGTGLGLSIAKGFVDVHQGRISAYNEPQGGACFVVELPRETPPELPPEEESAEDDAPTHFGD